MPYPLIHQSNQRPYHFLHGYASTAKTSLWDSFTPRESILVPVTLELASSYLEVQGCCGRLISPHAWLP
jgi:hypothetical protein